MSSFITPHCISAYVIYKTSQGTFYLLIRRCGDYLKGSWQMISGGIEKGETAKEAALREIHEETGLTPHAIYLADAVETFYMESNDKIAFVPVFVAFVEDLSVRLSPKEHDTYEWLSFENAKERLLWTEQKRVIAHVHENFVLKKPSNHLKLDTTPSKAPSKVNLSRTGVYGLVQKEEKLLLVKQQRGPHAGKWDLPGGKIELEETVEEALQREFVEEVGLSFDSMKFYCNITATIEGINEENIPYILHQIGLIYQIDPLELKLQSKLAELEHGWINLKDLEQADMSPFVQQIVEKIKFT